MESAQRRRSRKAYEDRNRKKRRAAKRVYNSSEAGLAAQRKRWSDSTEGSREDRRAKARKRSVTPAGRASMRDRARRYATKSGNRLKTRARHAVNNAISAGRLVRPTICSRCGTPAGRLRDGRSNIQFHHTHGYARKNWFVGVFLCGKCHAQS